MIPEIAKATINIRFNDLHTGESLSNWMQNYIKEFLENNPKVSCSFKTDQTENHSLQNQEI